MPIRFDASSIRRRSRITSHEAGKRHVIPRQKAVETAGGEEHRDPQTFPSRSADQGYRQAAKLEGSAMFGFIRASRKAADANETRAGRDAGAAI